MALTRKEKAVALIANGIAVYSLLQERDMLPDNATMYDFVMRAVPEEVRGEVTAGLIDDVFLYVSSAHGS